MKALLTMLSLLVFTNLYSQVKCAAVIDWQYTGNIDIYDKPTGKIIYQLKNDSANEDFLYLTINNEAGNYFNVSISFNSQLVSFNSQLANGNKTMDGWIRKANYIGAYSRSEKFPMSLTLYKNKKISDSNKVVIENWTPSFLTIEKCANEWTLVSLHHHKKLYKGWIETNKLCANSYTYCN